MVIDIIDYREEQYAELSDAQLLEIRDAQQKKNARIMKMYEDMRKLKQRAVDNGTYYSRSYVHENIQLQEDCDGDILQIKEELVFYLQYTSRLESVPGLGYTLDYSLSTVERYHQVRTYYEEAYSDPKDAYEAFKEDKIARTYLCDTYAALADYLWALAYA